GAHASPVLRPHRSILLGTPRSGRGPLSRQEAGTRRILPSGRGEGSLPSGQDRSGQRGDGMTTAVLERAGSVQRYVCSSPALAALVAIALGRADVPAARPARAAIAPWLAELHGLTALALLLFLLPHVTNHVTGIWSAATHVHVMKALRRVYRNPVVEPLLVAVVLFQIGSGVVLLWRRTARTSDLFGTLQTAAAAYLAVFLSSHLTAVFVLGR